jgi:hypothetical protein
MVDPLKIAPSGFTHLLIAVDKFTKWVEAKPIRKLDDKTGLKFIKDIVIRFGESLIGRFATAWTGKLGIYSGNYIFCHILLRTFIIYHTLVRLLSCAIYYIAFFLICHISPSTDLILFSNCKICGKYSTTTPWEKYTVWTDRSSPCAANGE